MYTHTTSVRNIVAKTGAKIAVWSIVLLSLGFLSASQVAGV
jgi:hypothetical protein